MEDFDKNVYESVIIGTLEITKDNLKSDHYTNGIPISNRDRVLFNNDLSIKDSHGALYTLTALQENLIPDGWHIPTVEEWQTLIDYFFINRMFKRSSSLTDTSVAENPITNTVTYTINDIKSGYNWTVVGCSACGGTKPAPTIISGGGINDNFIELVLNTKTSKISVEYINDDLSTGFTIWEYRVIKNPNTTEESKIFSNAMNGMSLGNGINVNHDTTAYYWVAPTINKPSQRVAISVRIIPELIQENTNPDGIVMNVTMPARIIESEWKFMDVPIGAACSIKCIKD
jgi:uncharacterized protein (TIGR02145 family)